MGWGVTRAKLPVVLYTCHQGARCSQECRLSANVILRTLEPSSPFRKLCRLWGIPGTLPF